MCKTNFFTHTICISVIFLIISLSTGCGIPSYPYLYPPDPGDQEDERLYFTHDSDNDPTVFVGYEIFYRFYSKNPNELDIESKIDAVKDMETYFTSSLRFRSVIYEESGSAYNFGFRRVIVDTSDNTPPQLTINSDQIDNSFMVEFVDNELSEKIEIVIDYESEGTSHELFRSAKTETDEYKGFLPLSEYDIENDSDIVDQQNITQDMIDGLDDFYVAFFAVPYGMDPETLASLYANGTHEGMEYIGSFKL